VTARWWVPQVGVDCRSEAEMLRQVVGHGAGPLEVCVIMQDPTSSVNCSREDVTSAPIPTTR
jgi:hypothetical protein